MNRMSVTVSICVSLLPIILVLSWLDEQPRQIQAATTLTVCASGCDYASIQAAIDAAQPGDTVAVASGDYTESLTLSKTVSLLGANAVNTIVHAAPNNRVLTVTGETITPSVVISGLTLMGGLNAAGGGLSIQDSAQPHVENVVLFQNHALDGGGLFVANGQPQTLVNVSLIGNSADNYGGGGYLASVVTFIGGQVSDNNASQGNYGALGGGLYADNFLTLSGTVVSHNNAYKSAWQCPRPHYCSDRGTGGGVWATYPITIINSRFEGNSAYEQGDAVSARQGGTLVNSLFVCNSGDVVYAAGNLTVLNTTLACDTTYGQVAINVQGQATITNTLIAGTKIGLQSLGAIWEDYTLFSNVITTVSGTIYQGGHSFQGNPLFTNPVSGNYHLTIASPAIDAGINTSLAVDFEGDQRPIGARTDIGFDEFVPPFALYLPQVQRSAVQYQITTKSTGRCLDVLGGSLDPLAAVISYPCNGQDNQTWLADTIVPEISDYRFNAKHSRLCLDVLEASLNSGAAVIQWSCHGQLNQLWRLEAAGNNYYKVKARHSNKCLDADGPMTPASYVTVIQNDCQNKDSQLWKFEIWP